MWPLELACQDSNPAFSTHQRQFGACYLISLGFIFIIDKRKVMIISISQEALEITQINTDQGTWCTGNSQVLGTYDNENNNDGRTTGVRFGEET